VSEPILDERQALINLSAALGSRDALAVRTALAVAGPLADHVRVEEAILQAYLFVGFPVVLSALAAWREAGRTARTVGAEQVGELEDWSERGEALCRQIYGSAYDKLRSNVKRLHPDIDRWMILEGYGKVLGRPELDVQNRELCIVALLAAAGHEPQLHSHLRGALNVEIPAADVSDALRLAFQYIRDEPARSRIRALWERVQAKPSRAPGHTE
jgi:4-carboxymuconolactone decarboxylase